MPDFKAEIGARLSELQLSPAREAEIVEELSQHLEQEYERAVSGGASEEEARKKVLEELSTRDLLRRELKNVEHRVSQDPITSGTRSKTNIFADLGQDCATACACSRKIRRSRPSLLSLSRSASVRTLQSSASSTPSYCGRSRSNTPNNW